MTSLDEEIADWPDAIESLLAKLAPGMPRNGGAPLKRIFVLRETDSTQDAARRIGAQPGDIFAAGRQRAGRGRFGRAWADTGAEGLAVTFVLERTRNERLMIISAVAAAQAAEAILKRGVSIKWPNDIIVNNRKLAGVLIEQTEHIALIGIGMNVLQGSWPNELAERAISLQQAGASGLTRLDVLKALVRAMHVAIELNDSELLGAYTSRDLLHGKKARFSVAGREIVGVVQSVDPLHGLRVRLEQGDDEWLPASAAQLLESSAPDSGA